MWHTYTRRPEPMDARAAPPARHVHRRARAAGDDPRRGGRPAGAAGAGGRGHRSVPRRIPARYKPGHDAQGVWAYSAGPSAACAAEHGWWVGEEALYGVGVGYLVPPLWIDGTALLHG